MYTHYNHTRDTAPKSSTPNSTSSADPAAPPATSTHDTATTNHSAIMTTAAAAITSNTINNISRSFLAFLRCSESYPLFVSRFLTMFRREKDGRIVAHEAVGAIRVRTQPSERDEDDIRSDPKAGSTPPPIGKHDDVGINSMYEVIARREERSATFDVMVLIMVIVVYALNRRIPAEFLHKAEKRATSRIVCR